MLLKHENIPHIFHLSTFFFTQMTSEALKLLMQNVVTEDRCIPNIHIMVSLLSIRVLKHIRKGFGKMSSLCMYGCCSMFGTFLALKYLVEGVAKSPVSQVFILQTVASQLNTSITFCS